MFHLPELARHLVDQGAMILFVPYCTDVRSGQSDSALVSVTILPFAGAFPVAIDDSYIFTPETPLAPGDYAATAFGVEATTPMVAPYSWSFSVE